MFPSKCTWPATAGAKGNATCSFAKKRFQLAKLSLYQRNIPSIWKSTCNSAWLLLNFTNGLVTFFFRGEGYNRLSYVSFLIAIKPTWWLGLGALQLLFELVWDDILSTLTCHRFLKSWFLTTWHLRSFYPISCVFFVSTFLDSGHHLCHLPLSIWCGFWLQESSETDSRQKAHVSTLRPWVVSERRRWRRPRGWLWRNTMESWPWIFRCSDIAAFFFVSFVVIVFVGAAGALTADICKAKKIIVPQMVVSSSQTCHNFKADFCQLWALASLTEPRAEQTKATRGFYRYYTSRCNRDKLLTFISGSLCFLFHL